MKVALKNGPVDQEEIKNKLQNQFPQYKIKTRNKFTLVVEKSGSCGTIIMTGRKDKMSVMAGFPNMGTAILFNLSFPLLGIVIPAIVYFTAFHPKMKKLENEVGAFLTSQYNAN
jgi:superoxide dismutase